MERSFGFTWNFCRVGGFDQLTLRTADELRHLDELDPKLWVALSCPATGLEFDERTLALIDTDADGRIRIPEVVAAVRWTCARLKDPVSLVDAPEAMPLDAITTETEEGRRLVAAGREILANRKKAGASELTPEDVVQAAALAAQNLFNGDGILPPLASMDSDVREFIEAALASIGGVRDSGGKPGIDRSIAAAFVQFLEDLRGWEKSVSDASSPLGENTAEAWELMQRLAGKIDDYFLRCEIASYAPGSETGLNPDDTVILPLGHGMLEMQALSELPLSRIEADRPLPLKSGLNPAWRDAVERFAVLVQPVLGQADGLSRENWHSLRESFEPYAAALNGKPVVSFTGVTIAPTASPDSLSSEQIRSFLEGDVVQRFNELAEKDASAPAAITDVAAVERLVLFHRHLYRLLMNFVSFYDFYTLRHPATFQAGTLYIDGRSCRLCVPVADVAKHATLASYSQLCLVYCDCRRRQKDEPARSDETRTIVAAITAGDSDLLMEGRNGVFIDNDGNDWDATVVKLVSNPISLWQALWSPYKRLGRMITEQVEKFATAKDSSLMTDAGAALNRAGTSATAATATTATTTKPGAAFDIGKSAGILAAIGLALGALGTALASIVAALFTLHWWQFPLVVFGVFALVSGPSLLLAWLRLRRRTLGPLLEASGWAVNSQVSINFFLGRELTAVAAVPDNSTRSLHDPLKKSRCGSKVVLLGAVMAGVVVASLWLLSTKALG